MKGLFQAHDNKSGRKTPDEMSAAATEEKPGKKERLSGRNDNLNAFLGEGTAFNGTLTFEGSVRIDGRLDGEIFTKDTLAVGKGVIFEGSGTMGKKTDRQKPKKDKAETAPLKEVVSK